MSRKISVGAALALALLMVAASIPLTMLYAQNMQNRIIPDLPGRMEKFRALEEIRQVVQNEFYRGADEDAITAEMVRGYIAGLGDEHSRYLSAEEYSAYRLRIAGQQPELGLELSYDTNPGGISEEDRIEGQRYDGLVINYIKRDSPAERVGLRRGDQVIKIETETAVVYDDEDLTADNALEHIIRIANIGLGIEEAAFDAVESALSVTISYNRDGEARPPVRVHIGHSVPTISTELMASAAPVAEGEEPLKNVGYIKIFAFYANTAAQLNRAIVDLWNVGARYFIIDLRGTSEGTIEFAFDAINELVSVTTGGEAMATIHYRGSRQPEVFTSDRENLFSYFTDGMAILINQFTAGPAELFAYCVAASYPNSVVLVGRSTMGVNTVQRDFPLAQVGGAALVSVGTVVPVGGDPEWNRNGVQPTPQGPRPHGGILEYNERNENSQLRGAINYLTLGE